MTTRTISILVAPPDEPIFSEMAYKVSIVDEAAGEFVEVESAERGEQTKFSISPDHWPYLRKAINKMIKQCRQEKDEKPCNANTA